MPPPFNNDIAQCVFKVRQPRRDRLSLIPRRPWSVMTADRHKLLFQAVHLGVEVRVMEDFFDV